MQRLWTHDRWAAAHPNRNALLKLHYVTGYVLFADVMHCKYMGTDTYFIGSVLWLLCYSVLPGTAAKGQL